MGDWIHGATILVTGAAKRLGRAIALDLASRGAKLVLQYHNSQGEAESLAEAMTQAGRTVALLQGDQTERTFLETVLTQAEALAGPVDAVINCAASFPENGLLDFTLDTLQDDIALNAYAPLALARQLAARERRGAIVNLLDCRITDYDRRHVSYHLSKRMLHDLTRLLAVELAPEIRVNAVAPGVILPPEDEPEGEAWLESMRHTNLLQRTGTAQEIADAVAFLLGQPFMTGQTLFIDGGRHLKSTY